MTTISILLICSVIIYLVWNYFELVKLFDTFKENRNEFDVKIFDKFIDLENKISNENKPLIHRIANNEKSVKDNEKILESLILDNKQTSKEIKQLRENIDKDVIELNTDIQKIKKSKQKIKISDFDNLVNRVEKLEIEISAPAFHSYKSFIAELENHKSKIRTSKGRVSLNRDLIENMINDGYLNRITSYTFAELQTKFMEYLQCKKASTTSKIIRLTDKGLLRKEKINNRNYWSVNI